MYFQKYFWSISSKFLPWGWGSSAMPMSLHPLSIASIPRHKICKKYQDEERYPTGRDISWPNLVLHWAGWPVVRCAPQPHERYLMAMFGTASSRLTPGRDILWPCMWHFGHIEQMSPHPLVETSYGHIWYYCEQANLQSEVPPTWDVRPGLHLIRCQVRSTSCQMYPSPQLKMSYWHGKIIDPCGWLLHHKRPFTQEGDYLVVIMIMPHFLWMIHH